jgi:hypothetical protein
MPSIQRMSSSILVLILLVRPFTSTPFLFPLGDKIPMVIWPTVNREDVEKYKPELASAGAPAPADPDPYLDYVVIPLSNMHPVEQSA